MEQETWKYCDHARQDSWGKGSWLKVSIMAKADSCTSFYFIERVFIWLCRYCMICKRLWETLTTTRRSTMCSSLQLTGPPAFHRQSTSLYIRKPNGEKSKVLIATLCFEQMVEWWTCPNRRKKLSYIKMGEKKRNRLVQWVEGIDLWGKIVKP